MKINWNNEKENYLLKLRRDKHTWKDTSKLMSKEFDGNFTLESCRNKYRSLRDSGIINVKPKDEPKPYKEEIKMLQDGSHTSDKLIELSEEEMKDKDAVLLANGYSPDEWELTSSQSSMWHHRNKEDGTKTMFASKIKAKPITDGFNLDELLETINNIEPINIEVPKYKVKHKQLLEISLFDQHFGINSYDDYKETQSKISELITSRVWEQIVITVGSDMLHHNGFTNMTVSGTEIEHVDMVQAWEDARLFYQPLIDRALLNSNEVKVIYKIGRASCRVGM